MTPDADHPPATPHAGPSHAPTMAFGPIPPSHGSGTEGADRLSQSYAVAKADSRQFVRIEFARSLVNIRPGEARHPWHWCIIVQDGHIYAISSGHSTLADAVQDFVMTGAEQALLAETRLAGMYAGPHEWPYDLAVVNAENKEGERC